MTRNRWTAPILALTGCLALITTIGCDKDKSTSGGGGSSSSGGAVNLTGAGATFPAPLYGKWVDTYTKAHPDIHINYQAIGSGGGIKQVTEKTVDFGASDGPMNDQQLGKAPGILHIPTTLGAVVPIYNIPGLSKPLVFDGPVLADMFMGKIAKWDDERFKKLNPDVTLPDKPITIVHRSDGSGTTYIWTDYLSRMSKDWAAGPGKSTTVNWPAGRGAKGSDGVAADVKQNEDSLGYVELLYAANNNIGYGDVVNAAGKTIHASTESVTAAAAGLQNPPDDLRISLVNAPGDTSYPISSLTWILIYQDQPDASKGKATVDFLWWCIHDGQAMCAPLSYAPLPKEFVTVVEKKLHSVTAGGKALLADAK